MALRVADSAEMGTYRTDAPRHIDSSGGSFGFHLPENLSPVYTEMTMRSNGSYKRTIDSLVRSFWHEIEDLPGVEGLYAANIGAKRGKFGLRIWTILSGIDREVQSKIARKQLRFMKHNKGFSYDFNILFRQDQSMEQLKPRRSGVIEFRKD